MSFGNLEPHECRYGDVEYDPPARPIAPVRW